MRKLFALVLISMLTMLVATSCTDNQRAKKWGGNMSYTVQPGEHFVNATWKDADLWYLTKEMKSTDTAETYTFKEKSDLGIQNGTVILIESRK